jgi:hypothetical protein
MRYSLLLFLLLSLSACQTIPETGEQAPAYYAIKPGSTFTLTQAITIPANYTSVYIQFGKVTTYSGRDQYEPNCKFELYPMSNQPRPVRATRFTVTRVVRDSDYVQSDPMKQYARLGGFFYNNDAMVNYMAIFYLASSVEPDVYRLTCQYWADQADGRDLTVGEVRQTLMPLIQLEVKTSN